MHDASPNQVTGDWMASDERRGWTEPRCCWKPFCTIVWRPQGLLPFIYKKFGLRWIFNKSFRLLHLAGWKNQGEGVIFRVRRELGRTCRAEGPDRSPIFLYAYYCFQYQEEPEFGVLRWHSIFIESGENRRETNRQSCLTTIRKFYVMPAIGRQLWWGTSNISFGLMFGKKP